MNKIVIYKDTCYPNDDTIKIIIIGDPFTGKSNIVNRICQKDFISRYSPTGNNNYPSLIYVRINDAIIQIQIYDTKDTYYSNNLYSLVPLALIVYSVDNVESFSNIRNWLQEVRKKNKYIKTFLIGNKNDLVKERKISAEKGEQLKNELKMDFFCETSAKNGYNIYNNTNIDYHIIENIIKHSSKYYLIPEKKDKSDSNSIIIQNDIQSESSNCNFGSDENDMLSLIKSVGSFSESEKFSIFNDNIDCLALCEKKVVVIQ